MIILVLRERARDEIPALSQGLPSGQCLRQGMDPALVMVEMTEEQRMFNDKL